MKTADLQLEWSLAKGESGKPTLVTPLPGEHSHAHSLIGSLLAVLTYCRSSLKLKLPYRTQSLVGLGHCQAFWG